MSHLSRFLAQHPTVLEHSLRGLADKLSLNPETLRRALQGIGVPDDSTLRVIAAGLPGVKFERLRELAERDRLGPFRAPEEFDLLDHDERSTVLHVGRQLLASAGKLQQVGDVAGGDDAPELAADARPKGPGRRRRSSY